MENQALQSLQHFRNYVGIKFQLYNSLFTALPFHRIEKTGVLLSLFLLDCEEGYNKKYSPSEIIDKFLKQNTAYEEEERIDLLFRFVQYAERQVTLFDALEDAAFAQVNDLSGPGTVKQLCAQISQMQKEEAFIKYWEENRFKEKSILKQFFPGLPIGLALGAAILLMLDSGWYVRANMVAYSQSSPIVIFIAIAGIVAFTGFFYKRFRWEMNEQAYKQLKMKSEKNKTASEEHLSESN